MSYPEYAKVNNKMYKINTDFKVALRCSEVYNSNVRDEEKVLAIIYLLFGDEGLNNPDDWEKLIEKAQIYLLCGKEPNNDNEIDMDFEQDEGIIRASFYTDYQIKDVYQENLHWWYFNELLNGLTEKCALNRTRELRNFDTSKIKDTKAKNEIEKAKSEVRLRNVKKPTEEQQKASDEFYKQIGL